MVEASLGWIFHEAAFQLSGGWITFFIIMVFMGIAVFFINQRFGLAPVLFITIPLSYAFSFFGGIFLSIFYANLIAVGGVIGLGLLYLAKQ